MTIVWTGVFAATACAAALGARSPSGRLARRLERVASRHTLAPAAELPPDLALQIGRALRGRLPVPVVARIVSAAGDGAAGPTSAGSDRTLGCAALALLAGLACALVALPLVGTAAPLVAVLPPATWLIRRRRGHRQSRQGTVVRAALADTADLLAVAASAALSVHRAVEVLARAAPPVLRPEFVRVVRGVDHGRPLADGLSDMARRVGVVEATSLARLLSTAQRTGTPYGPGASRTADEVRRVLRHAAEEAARTAPVKMLFPLAFLILPSFLLLSAAPLLVTAFRTVHL